MSDIEYLTDAELEDCAELLEPLLSLRATALVAEVRDSRSAIAALAVDVENFRNGNCTVMVDDLEMCVECGDGGNYCSTACRLRAAITTLTADLATARDHLRVSEEQVEALGHMNEANVRLEKERDHALALSLERYQEIEEIRATMGEANQQMGRTAAARDHYRSIAEVGVYAAGSACPCKHTAPCSDRCTCVDPLSSSGCLRCCSYGSPEQRKAQAERLSGTTLEAARSILAAACRCGSGAHPRRCDAHPNRYDRHVWELNMEVQQGDRIEVETEARTAEAIADFVGDFMDCEPVGDWRLIPRQIRAGEWKAKP